MASYQFKKVLFIRFLSYIGVFIGIGSIFFQFGPLFLAEINYRKDKLFRIEHTLAADILIPSNPQIRQLADPSTPTPPPDTSTFSDLLGLKPKPITPVSTDFGIVIEKINANAKVIPNVNPTNEKEYTKALFQGVAQSAGSTNPGEPGNLFIFSHSADAPWNIARFNAVFYLLRELEAGDKINIFYQGKRFTYEVYDKKVVSPKDTTYLTNLYDKPVLTLQTCDPPGTLNNRLIVLAKLAGS